MPFGPFKLSGFGQELGAEALNHYSQLKNICIEMGDVDVSSSTLSTECRAKLSVDLTSDTA
jgi:hypothetical protein